MSEVAEIHQAIMLSLFVDSNENVRPLSNESTNVSTMLTWSPPGLSDVAGISWQALAASHLIDRYLAPVVVVLGLIGNFVSLIVFLERHMQRRSSSVYLAALSAVGVAFLTCVLLSWTADTRFDVYAIDGLCQIFTYVTYVSSFLGVWYVVGFTVERYVAVHYPLRRQSLCTANKARRTVGALAAFAAITYSFATWTSGVDEFHPFAGGTSSYRVCGPLPRYVVALSIVHAADTIVTLLLPFVVISVLNLRIAITVVRYNRARRTMSSPTPGRFVALVTGPSRQAFPAAARVGRVGRGRHTATTAAAELTLAFREPRSMSRQSTLTGARNVRRGAIAGAAPTDDGLSVVTHSACMDQSRATKLLMTVSAAFLVLNLPRHVTRTYSTIVDTILSSATTSNNGGGGGDDDDIGFRPPPPEFLVCQKLFQLIHYVQFAVNIVLYATIGGSNFNGALRRIGHRTKRRLTNASAAIFKVDTWRRRLPVATDERPERGCSLRFTGKTVQTIPMPEAPVIDRHSCREQSLLPISPSVSDSRRHQVVLISPTRQTGTWQSRASVFRTDAYSEISLD